MMKQILKEGIHLKGQAFHHVPIAIFLAVLISVYLIFVIQPAFSKDIKALETGNNNIQQGDDENPGYLYNKWHFCINNNDDNASPKDLKIKAIERLSSLKNNKELFHNNNKELLLKGNPESSLKNNKQLSLKDNEESSVNIPDKKALSDLDDAISQINKSLKESLWRDPWHIHWAEGSLVFNAEGRSAQNLKRVINNDNETVRNIATEVLHNLICADYILAMTALKEAQTYTNTSEEVKTYIRKSEEYLQSGKKFCEDPEGADDPEGAEDPEKEEDTKKTEDPEKTIEYFRKSWHFASLALTRLPTVSINVSPATISLNETATLTWRTSNANIISIDNGIGQVNEIGSIDISLTQTTTYTITASNPSGTATDNATVTITVSQLPAISINIDPAYIHTGEIATLTWTASNADIVSIDKGIGQVDESGSIDISPSQTTTYTITASNPSGTTTDTITLKVIHTAHLPEGSLGKQYEELIPEDASIEAYDEKRFCIITGFAYTMDETGKMIPFPNVTVTLHNHPEYGTSQTNEEGRFAIPTDGGGIYTVVYEKEGYIRTHRKVKTFFSEVVLTKDDPVLIQKDTKTTQVQFDGNPDTITVHESTPVTDERGYRSCTLVFTGDNMAYTSDGTKLDTITTSVTEYTTPRSMPAMLPPYTQFTYCAEFSAQEAEGIRFEKPVIAYVDDFMGFGTGGIVPVGFYDRERALWVPCRNGIIVTLLDTNGDDIVDALDADGDGIPDDINDNGSFADDVLGLHDPDRYQPNTTYWRIEIDHFSPGDLNWSMLDYPLPNPPAPPVFDMQQPMDCKTHTGSYAEHRSRILHEDIPLPGTDWTLHYASNRTSGYKYRITIPITDKIPSCSAILICVEIGGRRLKESLLPSQYDKTELIWNGLDFRGNEMYGTVPVDVYITYFYIRGTYMIPVVNRFADRPPELLKHTGGLFGWPGSGYFTSKPGQVSFRSASSGVSPGIVFPRTLNSKYYIHVQRKPRGTIARGWTLSPHHDLVRDPVVPSALYKGDGTFLENQKIIKTIAGTGTGGYNGDNIPSTQALLNGPIALAADSRDNLYILQERHKRVRKVDTDGIITTIAGGGSDTQDGVPATLARLNNPKDIATDNEGNIYIIDHHSIRKVDTNGIITTIVNNEGKIGYHGDGGPAQNAWLCYPTGIACDSNGNIFIADSGNNLVRMINTNGIINTIAGNGTQDFTTDQGPAVFASVTPYSIDVDSQGNIYILDSRKKQILKISPGGIISTLADLDLPHITSAPYKIAVDSRYNLCFINLDENVIKMINQNDEIVTIAGNGDNNHGGDSGAPGNASFSPMDIAIGPTGDIYIADWWHERVRKISSSFVFATDSGILVPDDSAGHIMAPSGRHLSTIDLNTGKTLLSFGYERSGLISIKDRFGNETRINRGYKELSIISPHGMATMLTIDNFNNLRKVTYPDGSNYHMEYTPDGLMTHKYDPKGSHFQYLFDMAGRLTDVFDPESGHWNYQRTIDTQFNVITLVTTGEGNTTTYTDRTYSTGYYTSIITSPSGESTDFTRSPDGLLISKELPCGMSLLFGYGIDPQYRGPYIQSTSEKTPFGLTLGTCTEKTYKDTNGDGFNDLITTYTSINYKVVITLDNTIEGVKTSTSLLGRTITTSYDPNTLLTKSINIPGLHETSYDYDTRGRLTSVNTHTRSTGFSYNEQGLLEFITGPQNQTTTYNYD
ncbi:MAG: hypothetical protein ACMUIU_11355, partial [bacterium]